MPLNHGTYTKSTPNRRQNATVLSTFAPSTWSKDTGMSANASPFAFSSASRRSGSIFQNAMDCTPS